MLENEVSARTYKKNLLKTVAQPFKLQYSKSVERIKRKSSMHTLAHTVYDKSQKTLTPGKRTLTPINDPEAAIAAVKGLDMRASQITSLSNVNTFLLAEKHKLTEKIACLRELIAKQTRLRNRAETNWKTHSNHNQYATQSYQELCNKLAKLNEAISDVTAENKALRGQIHKLAAQNSQKDRQIEAEDKNVAAVHNRVNTLKNNVAVQEHMRNDLKIDLISEQRVMGSCSVVTKEREEERAMLLLQINENVRRNKI